MHLILNLEPWVCIAVQWTKAQVTMLRTHSDILQTQATYISKLSIPENTEGTGIIHRTAGNCTKKLMRLG